MIMKFGYFDDASKEYVITTPKTPLPWINYLGCNDFFTLISNTCGGYTFYKDAKLLRITRYRYNAVHLQSKQRSGYDVPCILSCDKWWSRLPRPRLCLSFSGSYGNRHPHSPPD